MCREEENFSKAKVKGIGKTAVKKEENNPILPLGGLEKLTADEVWTISADKENTTWIYNSDSTPSNDTISSVENDFCGNTGAESFFLISISSFD